MFALNQHLQLVIAQISIEQAEQSTKQTAAANELAQRSLELSNIMARDSAIGRKNSERSTQLTLLAAIYLPLTLATGVFGEHSYHVGLVRVLAYDRIILGMNIKEINGGTPRFWWVLVLAVLLLIPSGIFITYILLTSKRDKRLEQQQQDQDDQDEKASRLSLRGSGGRPTPISTTVPGSERHRRPADELSERTIDLPPRTSGEERAAAAAWAI
ncbi:unnamed protein product [Zymoseptoria tritici ST99CH_3D1]|nr:unnamed protein product [Zymoseptoria tritici ST99CH_3D1]